MMLLLGLAIGWIAGGAVYAHCFPRYEYTPPAWITVADARPFQPGSTIKVGSEYARVIDKTQQTTSGTLFVSVLRRKGRWER